MFSHNRYLNIAKQVIISENIYLRMAEKSDYLQFHDVRKANQSFLTPFEPVWGREALSKKAFYARVRNDRYEASNDRKYAFLIFKKSDDRLIGGINMNNVQRGVFQACSLGYWMGKSENSKGFMTEAVQILTQKSFETWHFNRVQAATLIDNYASIRVLEKCGFANEGMALKYLKINGHWQDHLLFAKIAAN